VSIDDRIRAATEATAATVRQIRPLTLPDELPGAARPRRRGLRHAWGNWLIPLAAAAAVIALATTLVAVRDLPGGGRAAGTPPAGNAVAGLPRYGVVLTKATAKIAPEWGSGSVEVSNLSVIDTRTGKQVALVTHPAGISFAAVSGAADDRTFAVSATYYDLQRLPGVGDFEDVRVFYLLRIDPGGSQPVKLTRLAIPAQPQDAVISGFALSPDGRTLAVLEWCTVPGVCDRSAPGTLRLYSVATGKALRVWTWGTLPDPVPSLGDRDGLYQNSAGLTWLAGGRTLAFTYYAHGQAPALRTLDTTAPAGDLAASSRRVLTLPSSGPHACAEAVLTPDGQTVVCATQFASNANDITGTLEIDAYSAATGKRERALYRYTGPGNLEGFGALGWVGPGSAVVVMVDTAPPPGTLPLPLDAKLIVGAVAQGELIPLLPGPLPLLQGPGAIAF
jgi:hypothetical protein